jgi:VIT1/CCC1 family predicted Fe2+/Mn2+ transporter
MATTVAPLSTEDVDRVLRYWTDERLAADRYRALARLDASHRALLQRLASDEERHAAHWKKLLVQAGMTPREPARPWRTRGMLAMARMVGVERVLRSIIGAETADRERYRYEALAPAEMAQDEASHGRQLGIAVTTGAGSAVAAGEGRHRTSARGSLRAAVFGVNDGLVSNLALIMGVAAGAADANLVVLAGIAGLVAGAGSMAAGEWISVQSQSELLQREIDVERAELEAFPDEELAELESIYRSKGLSADDAAAVARQIMSNTDMALDTLVREELGLDPSDLGSPWTAAVSSFFAFAVGAVLPLLPFLLATGAAALVVSMALSVTALAAVGAVLSVFTGRSAWWSALRMTLIGGSAAAVTYGIGAAVGMGVG